MKKYLVIIFVLVFATCAVAAVLNQKTVSSNVATVIDSTSGVLVGVRCLYDASENTSLARAIHFYDTDTIVAGLDHAHYLASITVPAGVYLSGDVFNGFITKLWSGANLASGISYDTGLVVSGTAANITGVYTYN